MISIFDSYNALPTTMRIYWGIAIAASVVFLIQMVLTFIGIGDTDSDFDGDLPSDSDGNTLDTGGALSLFSVRNVINFLLGFGWGGVCFSDAVQNPLLLGLIALASGCLFVAAFMLMWRQLRKIQTNGNFRIENCVGLTCSVYLRIPAQRGGVGKVQVSNHGSVLEIDAMTAGDAIKTGSRVRIIEVVDGHTLLVEAI